MLLLLHGADEYSAREELTRLRETGGFDFNQDTFTGEEADLNQIRTICDTLPFLSERRLVVLLGLPKARRGAASDGASADADEDEPADAPAKSAGKGKKGKWSVAEVKAFTQALATYAPRIPETTTLVILVEGKLEAAQHVLLEAAQQHGRVREFREKKGAQLDEWIVRQAQANDARMTPAAARLLVDSLGEDLRLLAGEIEKLSVAVGRGGEIGMEQVRALTPQISHTVIFELTDALARRDQQRALALLHEELAKGTAAQQIVGLMAAQTRRLLQVKAMAERGMRSAQIAQAAGIAPFVVEKTLPQARQFSAAQLEAAHRALLEADVALKNSRMTPELALDLLTLQFGAESH
jgi:DNA polymerase-3 subunit delta